MASNDLSRGSGPPPAGVPGGNGKYAALAVLLLGGVGALAVWKRSQSTPPVTVAPPLSPDAGFAGRSQKNSDDDIPPPPEAEDASAEPVVAKKAPSAGGNPCDVKTCSGSATPEVESALSFRAKQAHRCYDAALAQDPTLRGKMSITVRIGANGQACSATVGSNELASSPNVAACVAGSFRGQNFPAPRGGCVDATIPINFVPRQ